MLKDAIDTARKAIDKYLDFDSNSKIYEIYLLIFNYKYRRVMCGRNQTRI